MNNLYTTHNDWRGSGIGVPMHLAPYQIDANMGWSAAVQEMLLFSVPGKITVLPAIAGEWERGSVQGLLARGGVEVAIAWDLAAKRIETKLRAKNDQWVELNCPFSQGVELELKANEESVHLFALQE
jgi:alpha-L-fucosidase 2